MTGLEVRGLSVVLGSHPALTDVDLDIRHGEVVALVGPNGAGKSSVLGAVAGDVEISAGTVHLDGADLLTAPVRESSRRRAVLLQETHLAFGFRVRAVVAMGRTPWWRTDAEDRDDEVVDTSMERADVSSLADRFFPSLSGGEKARASFARVLAQETPLVLLDEPTAALDIRHQEQVLGVARELATASCAVGIVLHDLSLAAAWADRLCVLDQGRVRALGTPAQVLDPVLLEDVYGHPVDVIRHAGQLVVVPRRRHATTPPVNRSSKENDPCVPVT